MATSEGHCSQNVNISLVLQILFDGLFSGQSRHSSKELLCLKNIVLAHSIFDDTSNEKRPKMKNPPQIQTQIQICMFQNIAVALGGSITFRERESSEQILGAGETTRWRGGGERSGARAAHAPLQKNRRATFTKHRRAQLRMRCSHFSGRQIEGRHR